MSGSLIVSRDAGAGLSRMHASRGTTTTATTATTGVRSGAPHARTSGTRSTGDLHRAARGSGTTSATAKVRPGVIPPVHSRAVDTTGRAAWRPAAPRRYDASVVTNARPDDAPPTPTRPLRPINPTYNTNDRSADHLFYANPGAGGDYRTGGRLIAKPQDVLNVRADPIPEPLGQKIRFTIMADMQAQRFEQRKRDAAASRAASNQRATMYRHLVAGGTAEAPGTGVGVAEDDGRHTGRFNYEQTAFEHTFDWTPGGAAADKRRLRARRRSSSARRRRQGERAAAIEARDAAVLAAGTTATATRKLARASASAGAIGSTNLNTTGSDVMKDGGGADTAVSSRHSRASSPLRSPARVAVGTTATSSGGGPLGTAASGAGLATPGAPGGTGFDSDLATSLVLGDSKAGRGPGGGDASDTDGHGDGGVGGVVVGGGEEHSKHVGWDESNLAATGGGVGDSRRSRSRSRRRATRPSGRRKQRGGSSPSRSSDSGSDGDSGTPTTTTTTTTADDSESMRDAHGVYIPRARAKAHTHRRPWDHEPITASEQYKLEPNEVVINKLEWLERQLLADRAKWSTLMELHQMLGSLPRFPSQRKMPAEIRLAAAQRKRKERHAVVRNADEGDVDALLGSDSDSDGPGGGKDEGHSKLNFLNARTHYVARLYECLYRAMPNHTITRNRFVAAIRMFVIGATASKPTDIALTEVYAAPYVTMAYRVSEAFGTGEDFKFDWRQLLCSLRLVSFPEATALEQVRAFFQIYSSRGVLELGGLPDLPMVRLKKQHDADVAAALRKARQAQSPLERRLGLQAPAAPDPPPPPDYEGMSLRDALPSPDMRYPPNSGVDINVLPELMSLMCGTQLDMFAIQDLVGDVMASPYVNGEEADEVETYAQKRARIQRELQEEPVSGVSYLYRKHSILYFRTKVSLRAFDEMLCRPPLNRLFRYRSDATRIDPICELETLYHPLLWTHVADCRNSIAVRSLMQHMVLRMKHFSQMRIFDAWLYRTQFRQDARAVLNTMERHSRRSFFSKSFSRWRHTTVLINVALTMQCVVRGKFARIEAQYRRDLAIAAMYVQRNWKARQQVRRLRATKALRQKSALMIQCQMRRFKAVLITRDVVRRKYRIAVGQMRRARRALANRRYDTGSRAIQATWRGYLGRKAAQLQREHLEELARVEAEHDEFVREGIRQAAIAEATAAGAKAKAQAEAAQKAHDAAMLGKVRALRWQREIKAMKLSHDEREAKVSADIAKRNKEMRVGWKEARDDVKQKVRAATIELLQNTRQEAILAAYDVWKVRHKIVEKKGADALAGIDDSALSPEQRSEQKAFFAYVHKEAKRLIDEVKTNTGTTLLDDEARATAMDKYIKQKAGEQLETEKENERSELVAFNKFKRETEGIMNRRHRSEWAVFHNRGATMIQRLYRRYHANRWRFQEALRRYTKVEEEGSAEEPGPVYYVDSQHPDRQMWEKPVALRDHDLPTVFKEKDYDAYDITAIKYRAARKAELEAEATALAEDILRVEVSRLRRAGLERHADARTMAGTASMHGGTTVYGGSTVGGGGESTYSGAY